MLPDSTGDARVANTTAVAAISARWRRLFYALRTEGAGPAREAAAIGLGVFIGCLPFYGFHLLMCWTLGTVLRLNRLKLYLAANISNPFVAPWLLLAELQTGSWLRHGSLQGVSPRAIGTAGLGVVGIDLLLGSIVVGGVLAGVAIAATYVTLRSASGDAGFTELVRRAADRYVGTSITAWEFARGKLRVDPLYRSALFGRLLPSGGTLIDIGCGQGLMLALLAEARRAADTGSLPASAPVPPRFDRMIGVEIRTRVAALARRALDRDADVVQGDARALTPERARTVLLFDVLHLMDTTGQDAVLAAVARTLEPGGVLLVRDVDAAAGLRFRAVHVANRLKAVVFGAWRQRFCFRTRAEWLERFAAHGFDAEVRPMGEGTPFANVLFRLTLKTSL
jgi:uncharacterized protein (DUF2062 family)/SAM-dependent methyltransferase